jgi:DNA-binding ferritin-like protein
MVPGGQRNESEPEKTTNLHWNIKGNKLTMSHPKNETIPRVVLTIIELTSERSILEGGGVRVEYRRWAD